MPWRSSKQDLLRDQKEKVCNANNKAIQNSPSPVLRNAKNHNLRRAIKTDGSQTPTHGVEPVPHWSK